MQNKLTRNYLSKNVEISKDALSQDILNEINSNYERNLMEPAENNNEPVIK